MTTALRSICRTSIASFLALATTAKADIFTWDPLGDSGVTASGGAWDLATPNWSGAPLGIWPNDLGVDSDVALFGGAGAGPHVVVLGAPIVANGLTFGTGGYLISDGGNAANTLTLDGAAPTIAVTSAADSAEISAAISGSSGLVKSGAGTLILSGMNSYGGATSITAGTLSFSAAVNLGNALAGNSLAISNNAVLRFTGGTAENLGAQRSLAIGAGGATIEQSGTETLTLSAAITAVAGNTFIKTGNGRLILTGNSGGWSGDVVVDAGVLQVGNVAATQFLNGLGASSAARTVTVNSGATLDFQGRDATGNSPAAFVVNGGTISNTSGFTRLGTLTLNGGTIHTAAGNSTTYQALTFNGDVTVTGSVPSQVTTGAGANRGIHLEKSGGVVFNVPDVTGDDAADFSIAAPLLNITNNGPANGFIKNGAGTVALSGPNAFTGTLTLNDGRVIVSTANTANAPLAFSTTPGGSPLFTTNVAYRVGNITQSASGTAGVIDGTGTLALNGDRTFNIGNTPADVDLTIGVPVTNGDTTARRVIKNGAGTVQFNGVNTFSGTLEINDGTVIMNASQSAAGGFLMSNAVGGSPRMVINEGVTYRLNGNPQVNAAGNGALIEGSGNFGLFADRAFIVFDNAADDDWIINAPISNGDATARSWRKEGVGRLVLGGDNTYTGTTDLYRGTLVLDYSANNGSKLPDTTTATNLRGGTLILAGNASAPTNEVITSLGVPSGTNTIELNPAAGQALTFTLNAITRGTSQGVVDFRTTDEAFGVYETTTGNNLAGILGAYASFNGNRFAAVNGGTIGAAASVVQSDRSQWQAGDNVVINGALTGALSTGSVNSLVFDAPAANNLSINNAAGALTTRSGGVLVTSNVGANDTAISGGSLLAEMNNNNATAELVLTNRSNGTLSVSSTIGGNNSPIVTTQHLTLGGTGLIEISGRNYYAGNTAVQGNVRLTGGNAFSDFSQLTVSAGGTMTATGGALLDLDGSSEGVGNLSGGAFTNQGATEIRLGTNGTLTINQTGTTTYAGLLTGSGTVVKRGSGTLSVQTNAQSFTGEFQVLGGLANFLGNNAGLTGVSTVLLRGGSFLSEQNQGSSVDKIPNAAVVRLEGTVGNGLRVASNQNGGRTETAGKLEINASANIITLANTAGSPTAAVTTLNFSDATEAFSRANNATLLIRTGVADFGGGSTSQSNRVTFASGIADKLIGGSGAAGSSTISILPFAVGGSGSTTHPGNSFLTLGSSGLRPLNIATEYHTDYATAGATDNVSLAASAAGVAGKVINSLRLDTAAGAVDVTGTGGTSLTVTSGAVLVAASAASDGSTIGGFDSIMAGGADASPDELVVHVTSSNAVVPVVTLNSALVDSGGAPTSLTKTGNGTLVLNSPNGYTGATTVNQGVLQFNSADALGNDGLIRVAGGTLTWGAGNTTDISAKLDASPRTVELLGASPFLTPISNASGSIGSIAGSILDAGSRFDVGANDVTLANAIGNGGHGSVTKFGTGTLTLQASPDYTGPTFIREGAMNFATIAPNTTSALWIASDSGNVSATVTSGLNVESLVVGAVYAGTGASTANLTVNGGAVNIGKGEGDDFIMLGVRPAGAGTSSPLTSGTANFAAASSVNIDVAQILMAQPGVDPGTVTANLILSDTANTVRANQITVGNSPGPGLTGQTPTITLGKGTNDFAVENFIIGGQKINGAVLFGAGATAASTFKLRGVGGNDTSANLFIGDNGASGTGTNQSSALTRLDLSAGTADVKVNQLVLGRHHGGGGSGQGALIFKEGAIQAHTIQMGISDFRGGTSTNDGNTVGIITQMGGALQFADVSKGNGTGTYNWEAGFIANLTGSDAINHNVTIGLTGSAAHGIHVETDRTMHFLAPAGFSGSGNLTKSGGGTLILDGLSTYTGETRIVEGTVLANNAVGSAFGTGPVIVELSGSLGGTGFVDGTVIVETGATIAPGASIGTLTTGSLTMFDGSAFVLEINTSGTPAADFLVINGSLDLDQFGSVNLTLSDLGANELLAEGLTLPFATYSGLWNGGLFSVNGVPIADDVDVFAFGANYFRIDYNLDGDTVALVSVPEPATGAVLLGGIASLLALRRSRRQQG